MSQDLFSAPDYYELDGVLREEHLLVRDASTQIYAPVFGQMAYIGVRWKIK